MGISGLIGSASYCNPAEHRPYIQFGYLGSMIRIRNTFQFLNEKKTVSRRARPGQQTKILTYLPA